MVLACFTGLTLSFLVLLFNCFVDCWVPMHSPSVVSWNSPMTIVQRTGTAPLTNCTYRFSVCDPTGPVPCGWSNAPLVTVISTQWLLCAFHERELSFSCCCSWLNGEPSGTRTLAGSDVGDDGVLDGCRILHVWMATRSYLFVNLVSQQWIALVGANDTAIWSVFWDICQLQWYWAVFAADETKIKCDKLFLAWRCLFRFLFTFRVRFETMDCF